MENLRDNIYRYERKFFVLDIDRGAVEIFIKNHSFLFSEIYHQRVVNNIYFDYPQFENFIDNIDGNVNRVKYRIRWYGNMFGEIKNPVLELKIKNGLVGRKQSIPLNPINIYKGITAQEIKDSVLNSELSPRIKESIENQTPVILNRYRRKYFQTRDKKFRITTDDQQSFFKVNKLQNNFLDCFHDRSNIIIELKYDKGFDTEANSITTELPFLITKSSKYSRAVESLYC